LVSNVDQSDLDSKQIKANLLQERQKFKNSLNLKVKQKIAMLRKQEEFNQQQKFVKDVTNQIDSKDTMYFSRDLLGFTVLCLLKQNRRKY